MNVDNNDSYYKWLLIVLAFLFWIVAFAVCSYQTITFNGWEAVYGFAWLIGVLMTVPVVYLAKHPIYFYLWLISLLGFLVAISAASAGQNPAVSINCLLISFVTIFVIMLGSKNLLLCLLAVPYIILLIILATIV